MVVLTYRELLFVEVVRYSKPRLRGNLLEVPRGTGAPMSSTWPKKRAIADNQTPPAEASSSS
jgi:hypothetical protein